MGIRIDRRDGHDYIISPVGIRILLTSPIATLIDRGFTPTGPRCLHWLVCGGSWSNYCYRSDTNRRASFPCRLPIGGDWHHPSSWAHWDGSRVFYIEPYGLSASSASLLSRFAERYSLALEIEPCLRKNAPAIAVRIESQGGSLKLPKLTILRQEGLWSRGLWEWELPPE
jgi:hypothetical protein